MAEATPKFFSESYNPEHRNVIALHWNPPEFMYNPEMLIYINQQIEKLFEPFQRLNGRTAENGHHGLGLSIVRAIVVAHNAELAATPRSGGGLTVTVRLPRAAGRGETVNVGG